MDDEEEEKKETDTHITTIGDNARAPGDGVMASGSSGSCEPPAGIVFSNILPQQLVVSKNQAGYEILEAQPVQHDYKQSTKTKPKNKHRLRVDPMTYHNLLERRLRILANSGYVDEMRTFLQSTYHVDQLINRHDNKGRTALHFASSRGSDEIVHTLLEHGANPNIQDFNGNTPLHLAACTHHIRVITLLLRFGADASATDAFGKTPLHLALSRLNLLQKRYGSGNAGCYGSGKLKAEVLEIVGMLKEYFEKSGREADRLKMCEIDMRLMKVTTDDEVRVLMAPFWTCV